MLTTKSKLNKFKVGFSVGKKVGKANVRNKVKRRMKEAVYKQKNLLKTKMNYIFIAKSGSDKATYLEIYNSITYLLENSKN